MKHLIICREYPPSPGGGIGRYVFQISHLLAEAGETVHVISQAWGEAGAGVTYACGERLIIHRLHFENWKAFFPPRPHPTLHDPIDLALFHSGFFPESFAWRVGLLAEKLIEQEGIDVIEAQEYEAPLYYLMLRRALGHGPAHQPPCLIHLHSPTEFVARFNEWSPDSSWVRTAKKLEGFCIQAADALLCPSQTFARQAESHYSLETGKIRVIPLPLVGDPYIDRTDSVWKSGRICYVGRLERRKGIIEWLQAAIAVANDVPDLELDFVGTNILGADRISSQVILDELVPANLRRRFHFYGGQDRSYLPVYLGQARLAVVPSRWENFPYTCMETMSSGLPVIATRQGGMSEMITDGKTGWLVDNAESHSLASALHQALDASATDLAEMGRQASIKIRELCNPEAILAHHLEYRRQVAGKTAHTSIHFPRKMPGIEPDSLDQSGPSSIANRRTGVALIILALGEVESLRTTVSSLAMQTEKPGLVAIQTTTDADQINTMIGEYLPDTPWFVEIHPFLNEWHKLAARRIADSADNSLGVMILTAGQRLLPDCLSDCEAVLRHNPKVGRVSFWIKDPSSAQNVIISRTQWYQSQAVNIIPFGVFRIETLRDLLHALEPGQEKPDVLRRMAVDCPSGWISVQLPKILLVDDLNKKRARFLRRNLKTENPWSRQISLSVILRHPARSMQALLGILLQIYRSRFTKMNILKTDRYKASQKSW